MTSEAFSRISPDLYPAEARDAASGSAISWSAIVAGAIAAIALTLTLVTLGSAFGMAEISPWPGVGAKAATFTIRAGIWLIVTQWLSSMLGGYMTGRLRVRWTGLRTDEVFFRDTAHGFMSWAAATLVIGFVAASAAAIAALAPVDTDVQLTKEAAEAARKSAAAFATFTGLAMIVGAFIASVSGAIGGRLRDLHP